MKKKGINAGSYNQDISFGDINLSPPRRRKK
jgi:hypothetical protein